MSDINRTPLSSLPDRQLRNECRDAVIKYQGSLPDRQLRNPQGCGEGYVSGSLPDRQLRNSTSR